MTNFIDKYCEFASSLTDAPPEFHRYMAYAIVGVALNSKVWFPFGEQNIYPNFYMILIAPSSKFRKTTALNIASRVIRQVDRGLILPTEFTQEKILELLQTQPSGAFVFSEFKTFLGALTKDYNAGLMSFVTDLYDVPAYYSRKTKAIEITLENPCISILAATTIDWLTEKVQSKDVESGFLSRFLYVISSNKGKPMPIPPKMDQAQLNRLQILLEEIVKKMRGEMCMSDEAKDVYENWYYSNEKHIDLSNHDGFTAAATRMQIYLIKFGMITAIVDNLSCVIGAQHMNKAIQAVDWLLSGTEHIVKHEVSDTKYEKSMKRVLTMVKKAGGSIEWSTLLKNTHIKGKDLAEIVDTLETTKDLARSFEGSTTIVKVVGQ